MDAQSAPKIGKIIKRAREKKRWSQQEAADRLGVSRSALNAWENDRAYPRSSIGAIEELYEISLDDQPDPQQPSPEVMERLRQHVRDVLGDKAGDTLDAIDGAVSGAPPPKRSGGGGAGRSARRPAAS